MSLQMQMLASVPTQASIHSQDINNPVKNHSNTIIAQKIKNSTTNFKTFEIDIFNQIKDALNIRDVVEYYGVSLNSKGMASCPFHTERTASFKVYADSFYCFGCGKGGSVIDFTMRYFGLANIEAAKKLNEDFRLNLPMGGSMGAAERRPLLEAKNLVADFASWEKRAWSVLSRRFRKIHEQGKIILMPDAPNLWEHVAELAEMEYVGWLLDMMIANMRDFKAQVEFYMDYGEVVARYDR